MECPEANTHHQNKFHQNRSSGLRDIAFYRFSWQPPLILEILKFYWQKGSGVPRCIIMPNFVKIGQTIFEISRYFLRRWPLPSLISEILKFY